MVFENKVSFLVRLEKAFFQTLKSREVSLLNITSDRTVLSPSETRSGLIFQREDACNLSFPDKYFDRVLCSCVLHHVDSAESALTELRRVLDTNGKADVFLSCDPGFLFRLGRYFGPVREAKNWDSTVLNGFLMHEIIVTMLLD